MNTSSPFAPSSKRFTLIAGLLLATATGCKAKETSQDVAQAPTKQEHPPKSASKAAPQVSLAKKAAEIANQISKNPDMADGILERHGIDRDKLETMMFKIAGDPALRASYEKHRASLASR